MNTPSSLSVLLGLKLAGVQQVEKCLTKLVAEDADNEDNDIDSYTTSVIHGLSEFLQSAKNDLNTFQTIELAKRCAFFDTIKGRFDHIKEKMSRHVDPDKLNQLTKELFPILHDLCYFDFSRHRLSFASTVIEQLNTLEQYEQELLRIIEQMRDETHVNDALNTTYDALKNSRKKIVIAVIGCAKSTKSSFINYLLGKKVCPVDTLSATARVTRIIYGCQMKVYLEGEEGEEMNNIDSLYRKASELIVLEGDDRNDENKCKIKVVIELPIEQLKNIELWDLPGLNENPVLDSIVSTILPDVDLVFALLPIDGGVSFDFLNNIKIWLTHNRNSSSVINQTHYNDLHVTRLQRQVCFIITKIDSIASNNQADKIRDTILRKLSSNLLQRMKDELKVEMNLENINPMSSCRFISMCTESAHLQDFLHCQEEFYHKSSAFFTSAVNDVMHRRLDYLLQAIHEILDYDDIDRTINASQQLINIIRERQENLRVDLKKKMDINFESIREELHSHVVNLSKDWSHFGILPWNKNQWSTMFETIMEKFEESMKKYSTTIQQSATESIDNFFVSLDLQLDQERLVKQVMDRIFLENPYMITIGQHEIKSAPHRVRELAWIQATSISHSKNSNIFSRCLIPIRFVTNLREATRETLINMTEPSVQKIIDGYLEKTMQVINLSVQKQVNKILGEIESKTEKMSQNKNILEVGIVAKFILNNEQSIIKLYLDIQNEKTCAEYAFIELSNEKLGSSNSSVYAAVLAADDHSDKIPIAAKKINLQEISCQELRYMSHNHRNIVKSYGVQCSDRNDGYYILMEKLDCDLDKYLLENQSNLLDSHIDKMIIQIVNGLYYLHSLPLIHGDIKPTNIFVRKCEPPVLLISGLPFPCKSSHSMNDNLCYMAPELMHTDSLTNESARPTVDRFVCGYVANNSLSAKTDIYAFGVTITKIYEKSNIRRRGQYYIFWNSMADRCCSNACAKRPTCKEILAERLSYKKAGKADIST